MDESVRAQCEAILAYQFKDPALLKLALRHASTADTPLSSNERLEFLGDAVLGMVVCDLVFRRYPALREGDMTKIKSHAVSREMCAVIAKNLGLDRCLILGKGMQSGDSMPASLAAAALESVIGALYLDAGYEKAAEFVRPLVIPIIEKAASSGHQQNFKSVLQQHAQQAFGSTPAYRKVLELHGWGDLHTELHRLSLAGQWDAMGELIDDEVLGTFAVVAPIPELAAALRRRCDGVIDRVLPGFPAAVSPETVNAVLQEFRECPPVRSNV